MPKYNVYKAWENENATQNFYTQTIIQTRDILQSDRLDVSVPSKIMLKLSRQFTVLVDKASGDDSVMNMQPCDWDLVP